jgi:uncharacterized protein involved in type VI secretion and phage assembly
MQMQLEKLDRVITKISRELRQRYFGKFKAQIVDNADPEKRGRLQVIIPDVLGDEEPIWAVPCLPYGGDMNQGFYFIPENEAWVWVEFEKGDPGAPIWVGALWCAPGGETEVPMTNAPDGEDGEVQETPTCKIIKTLKGHTIQFEDADDNEMIIIKDGVNGHVITLNSDGIKVTHPGGSFIEITDEAFNIKSATAFTLDAGGQAVTIIGDTIDLNKG